MPTLCMHMEIANRCKDLLNIKNLDDFLFGVLYPDFSEDENGIKRDMMHYYIPYEYSNIRYNASPLPNVMHFIIDNKDFIEKDFYKGYLVHLISDYVFNEFDNMRIGTSVIYMTKDGVEKQTDRKREDFIICGNNYECKYNVVYSQLSTYVRDIINNDFDLLLADILLRIEELNNYLLIDSSNRDTKLYAYEDYEILFCWCVQLVSYYKDIIEWRYL